MRKKTRYRLRNWSDYNRSLQMRGSLTFWVSDEVVKGWRLREKSRVRGASPQYSDLAIQTMATVKAVFRQAGRQTGGLLKSIFQLMKIDLSVPDHSTLSRRLAKIEISLPSIAVSSPRHLVVD